ncbi:MAG TPA: hypothetical protein VLG14_07595 [Sphingomonas sp.]|jgi:TPR repeat protein|nr:hypothetical protein [Sphingomonas sp.]
MRFIKIIAALAAVAAGAPVQAGQNLPEAIRNWDAKCQAGELNDCKMIASAYENGFSVPRDLAKARAYYAKGCKPGDWTTGTACMHLFKMASLGEGGPKDMKKAGELAPTVCNSRIISQEVYLESFGLCKK